MEGFQDDEELRVRARERLLNFTLDSLNHDKEDDKIFGEKPLRQAQGFQANPFQDNSVHPEIADILNAEYDDVEIPDAYKCFTKISATGKAVKYQMEDDEYLGQAGITVSHMTAERLAGIGREVIPMLHGGFTTQGAACMFLLAYNLKATDGSFITAVYNGIEEISTANDVKIHELSTELRQPTFQLYELAIPNCDVYIEAAYYCYIAACTMRLYTKSSNNFLNAWEHIQSYFYRLYRRNAPVVMAPPRDQAIKDLATWYGADPRAKQTLYRLLYIGADSAGTVGLRLFCLEMHLTHTGLHLVAMFIALCTTLNCDPGLLLEQITVNEFSRQCDCIYAFLKMLRSKNEAYRRAIWKYGRIFDDAFLADIQTKQCPKLVCVFASALKAEATDKYQHVLNITHIASLPEIEKQRCASVARCIVSEIRKKHSRLNKFLPTPMY